jgi:hypothetical protein
MGRRTPTPYDEDLGFVTSRRSSGNSFVILYDGIEAGFDTSAGRWNMFCPDHGTLVPETNKAKATKMLKDPLVWCKSCARAKKRKERSALPMKLVVIEKTAEEQDREKRFWATLTKNNPEKQELFEKMYGVRPDQFWD